MMECTGRNSFYWLQSSWCSWSSQVIGNLCQKVNSTMESERFKAENRFRGILSIWGANTEIHQWDEPVDKHVRTTKCFLPHIHPVTIAQTFVLCSQFHQNTIMQGMKFYDTWFRWLHWHITNSRLSLGTVSPLLRVTGFVHMVYANSSC